jgi:site-specific recombinase
LDLKSEGRSSQMDRDESQANHGEEKGKKQARRLGGVLSSVLGLLLGLGGIVGGFLGLTEDVSTGALAIVLGVLGYYLGARRLGAATVVLGTVALFFVVAASTGLIPGVTPLGHGYD